MCTTKSWAQAEVQACLKINHYLHARKSLYVIINRQYHSLKQLISSRFIPEQNYVITSTFTTFIINLVHNHFQAASQAAVHRI